MKYNASAYQKQYNSSGKAQKSNPQIEFEIPEADKTKMAVVKFTFFFTIFFSQDYFFLHLFSYLTLSAF